MIRSIVKGSILAAMITLLPNAHSDIVSGLVNYWSFDSDFTDSAGSANNGTAVNQAAITTSSGDWVVGGGALELDGNGDYVRVSDHSEVDGNGSGGLTISAFVKARSFSGLPDPGYPNIVSKTQNVQYRFRFNTAGEALSTLVNDGGGVEGTEAGYSFNVDQWYHVATTIDFSAQEVRYYVNGTQIGAAQSITSTGIQNGSGYFLIGIDDPSGSEAFNGFIDDLRMYHRTLSSSDIAELSVIPEPSSIALLSIAAGLIFIKRRFYRRF